MTVLLITKGTTPNGTRMMLINEIVTNALVAVRTLLESERMKMPKQSMAI